MDLPPSSPFFEKVEDFKPAERSWEEFLATMDDRNQAIVDKPHRERDKAVPRAVRDKWLQRQRPTQQEFDDMPATFTQCWLKVNRETEERTMSEPLTRAQVVDRYGLDHNIAKLFCIFQGWKEDGSSKYRVIADHCRSWLNAISTQ